MRSRPARRPPSWAPGGAASSPNTYGRCCAPANSGECKDRVLEASVAVLELPARTARAGCVARHPDEELGVDRPQPGIGFGDVAAEAGQRTRRRKGAADGARDLGRGIVLAE